MANYGSNAEPPIQLSQVKPDFESILLQLQIALQQKGSWSTLLTSGTGETLLENMASVAAFNQQGIENGVREGFFKTARRDSSVYALTNDLGVRIGRKMPAYVEVELTRPEDTKVAQDVFPKYTQFTVGGQPYFNRDVVVFEAGAAITRAVLYKGSIKMQVFKGDGNGFRRIYLNEPGFVVSDQDVQVFVRRQPGVRTIEPWTVTDEGLWLFTRTDNVYTDETDGDGDCVLGFGDNIHGSMPPLGSEIIITYALTDGLRGNGGTAGQEVRVPSAASVQGKSLSGVQGGADEKPAEYYRYMAPHIRKANRRAVTDIDYAAIMSEPANIACAVAQGQSEVAPWDLRWMNQVRVCLLPMNPDQDTITDIEWKNVNEYMKRRKHAAIRLVRYDPTKILVDVHLTLVLHLDVSNKTEVVPVADEAVRNVFARRHDTLGKRIAITDITGAAKVDGVDYIEIDPDSDFVPPDVTSYIALNNLVISTRYTERSLYGARTRL